MSQRRRPSLNLELMPSQLPKRVAFHGLRWGLLAALALLTYAAYPFASGFESPVLQAGDVAKNEVIAPFAFPVLKSPPEMEAEQRAYEASVLPIYDFRPRRADSVVAKVDSLFARLGRSEAPAQMIEAGQAFNVRLTPEDAEYLGTGRRLAAFRDATKQLFRRELRQGVAASAEVENETAQFLMVRRNGSESTVRRDTIRVLEQLGNRRSAYHPDPNSSIGDLLFLKLVTQLAEPTLVKNVAASERERELARAAVHSVKDSVRANERIVDANEVVTPAVEQRLFALRNEMLRRGGSSDGRFGGTVGQILTNALLLAMFWLLLMFYRPAIYESGRQMVVLSLFFGIVIVGAAILQRLIAGAPELIPVPFAAMLLTALFRGRVAMVGAMVLAVLIASQAVYSTDAQFVALVGGVVAAVSVRNVRRRDQFLFAGALVAVGYLLAGLAVGLRMDWSLTEIGITGLRGGLNAVASAALVSTLLPAFESISGLTTDLTLLELSDPDRPLLRRLATEAPGTYAHSVSMANLCEAACNAVGAHGLLARVGCYYHDVGKVKKPQFFVENQSPGANPHDKLKPEVSAGIVRNHVRDGLQLAEEHKLPAVVKSFISEHHGTMEISYFLDRARTRNGGEKIHVEEFRYPGPKPRSVETALAMLADGVEAAVRVLDDPTPEKLNDVIEHIIEHRISVGQLEEAPLTMAQLARARNEFIRVLGGAFHNRIDYPASSGGIYADWEARSEA
ncbi:MAG: HDIG domain-containing protein [Gemmatimonadota bacterium]|nr:HDIG domain-containing protein [Gemmatimonadota bacterium]MDH3368098.1 HDIG domain-containing protein [Gemmatimonadota bacterium]MDH3478301.1 HDIG domain-containing protein [Gemmatimonadota bacterium]MDH3570176.1 HDIG domain-containing protein [Gemmatimonadota bacterium]MDH5550586.1 HDIG domain-containing protein [Gemmatimonadota bacterium]